MLRPYGVENFEIIVAIHKTMKMQSFLFKISLVFLLGNSGLLLFSSEILAQAPLHDAGSTNHDHIEDKTVTEETKTGRPTETGGTETGGPTETGGTETGGTGGTEGTETEGTGTGGTGTGQQNTTNNGNVDDFELLPEISSEGTEGTETETPETPETPETAETAAETPQPTPQATPVSAPGDTVSAPQVEFAPVGDVGSPTQAAAESAIAQLGAGTFGGSGDGAGGISVPASTQQAILTLLTGDPTSKSLFGSPILNPLIRALGQGGAGQLSAWKLAESLLGLLRGGKVDAKKLLAAVAAYNALIKASNNEFLLNPPAELVAIRAVLAELVSAAEAEGRTPD